MPLKTILVCLANHDTAASLLACAVTLARSHDAHLIALHTTGSLIVYPSISAHIPRETVKAFYQSQHEDSERIEAVFNSLTRSEDFPSEWRLLKEGRVTAADRIIESARAADVVMMTNAHATKHEDDHAQTRIIRECGRPVIVVPPDYACDTIGEHVMLGWSDTREATRAAHDLLTVVRPGSQVSILRVRSAPGDALEDFETMALANLYDRHGLRAQTLLRDRGTDEIVGVLTKQAFESGADLIATGAFGHSRAYDFVIGSVTFGLLREAKLPVLFST